MNARVGPADFYAPGEWNVICSICGRKMKSGDAVKNWQGMWRHRRCNDVRQPQDFVRVLPDDQTVPFAQLPVIDYIQININIPLSAQNINASGVILAAQNGHALQLQDGNAIMTKALFAQVVIPPYTDVESVNWVWASGGASIIIASPTAAVTQLLMAGTVIQGTNYSGVLQCTVTSTEGGVGTTTCNVSITA
jgi:hypothetical protein